MSVLENFTGKFKQFKPTTWSIKNRTAVYLLILFVTIAGVFQFATLPKEQFPDIVIPTIYVQTIYVGNSPRDIENLVTQPIEKQIKGITGAKINKINSTSVQDYSAITVEFNTDVKVDVALQKVKDALDTAMVLQKPVVLNVYTDPSVPMTPPHVTFKEMKAFASAIYHGDTNAWDMIRETTKDVWAEYFPGKG